MYIGSTDTRGLMHCLWEIIDNGVDEALAGAAHHVEVTLHPDDSVEVYDDGRGIPIDKEPRTGLPGVEVVVTKLHAGGKFGGGSYVATGGLHGVGRRWSTRSRRGSTSTSTGRRPSRACRSGTARPASSTATAPGRRSPRSPG